MLQSENPGSVEAFEMMDPAVETEPVDHLLTDKDMKDADVSVYECDSSADIQCQRPSSDLRVLYRHPEEVSKYLDGCNWKYARSGSTTASICGTVGVVDVSPTV